MKDAGDMIKVTVERRYGAVTVRSRVTATSIERALELAGEGASLVFPIDPETFFQLADTPEDVERLLETARASNGANGALSDGLRAVRPGGSPPAARPRPGIRKTPVRRAG